MTRYGTLKRSGFARKAYEPAPSAPLQPILDCRGVYAVASNEVVAAPKEVKAKPGKRTPTAVEKIWLDRVVSYGCVACHLDGVAPRPTAVHHLLRGGQRIGHLFSIGLCDPGHHQGGESLGLVSRHPFKARFEARYGTELELLGMLKQRLGFFDKAEYAA